MGAFGIMERWLNENDYEGLVNKKFDCGCGLMDFAPCGAIYPQCEPAILYRNERGDYYYDIPETTSAVINNFISLLKEIVKKIDSKYPLGIKDAAIIETAILRLQACERKDKERKLKEQA